MSEVSPNVPSIVEVIVEKECAALPPFACPICGQSLVEYDPEVSDDATETVLNVSSCDDLEFMLADELGEGFHYAGENFEKRLAELNLSEDLDIELEELLTRMGYDDRLLVLQMKYMTQDAENQPCEHTMCCGFHFDYETGSSMVKIFAEGFASRMNGRD